MSEYDLMVTQQQMLIDYQLELRKAAREAQLRQRQQQQVDAGHEQVPATIVLNAVPQPVWFARCDWSVCKRLFSRSAPLMLAPCNWHLTRTTT